MQKAPRYFGEWLKQFAPKGINELARRLGLPENTVRAYTKGSDPTFTRVRYILNKLGYEIYIDRVAAKGDTCQEEEVKKE